MDNINIPIPPEKKVEVIQPAEAQSRVVNSIKFRVMIPWFILFVLIAFFSFLWLYIIRNAPADSYLKDPAGVSTFNEQKFAQQTPDSNYTVSLLSPVGGEQLCLGDKFNIKWESKGLKFVRLILREPNGQSHYIDTLSPTHNSSVQGSGDYLWDIGTYTGGYNSSVGGRVKANEGYLITINAQYDSDRGYSTVINDEDNGVFAIKECRDVISKDFLRSDTESWTESNGQLTITLNSAALGYVYAPIDLVEGVKKGERIYGLELSFNITSRNTALAATTLRRLDEASNLIPPSTKYFYTADGPMNAISPYTTYTNAKLFFVVGKEDNEFIFTTGIGSTATVYFKINATNGVINLVN